jgi:hypothetical protein
MVRTRPIFFVASMVFGVGSYYLAEGLRKQRLSSISSDTVRSKNESMVDLKPAEF